MTLEAQVNEFYTFLQALWHGLCALLQAVSQNYITSSTIQTLNTQTTNVYCFLIHISFQPWWAQKVQQQTLVQVRNKTCIFWTFIIQNPFPPQDLRILHCPFWAKYKFIKEFCFRIYNPNLLTNLSFPPCKTAHIFNHFLLESLSLLCFN